MFLSFYHGDADEVAEFVATFESAIVPLSVGTTEGDGLSPGLGEASCLNKIADRYLGQSEATIVLVGATTWARRFVDWEIAATLHATPPRALLPVLLRSAPSDPCLPPRLLTLGKSLCVRPHPSSPDQLSEWLTHRIASAAQPVPKSQPALMRRDRSLSQRDPTQGMATRDDKTERPTP